ncbi:MAG: xylulokinase [Phyllobacteriaceae bacterium]|nr:xylulokinase [Phyllobacteriaceae bacterium]
MYLGIDLGTSSVKVMLIDGEQHVVGSASAALAVANPIPGWSEQDAGDWESATDAAMGQLKAAQPRELAAVTGIGLSGHMHGATLVDIHDRPIRPCILWNDTRSHAEAAELDAIPAFRQLTGNIVFPGFTAPKLLWAARHEPAHFDAIRFVLLPKDYLRLWLTGEHMSEMSDSAGTSWLDVGARRWSPELLAATGLEERQMPDLVEGTDTAGVLRPELASRWGMGAGVVVAGGAGDNAASAVGMGTVRDGDAFASLGTSGVLFAANNGFKPKPESAVHAFCHALPDTWHQMGVILAATDSLNWLADVTGVSQADLTAELGDTLKAPGSVTFLPYVSGERTPHNDALIRGAFAGIGKESHRATLTQAVVEGVAFAFADCRDALASAGQTVGRAFAVGGGARSRYWLKALSTALAMPLDIPVNGDFGAAFGAARLGLIAATGADPLAVMTPPAAAETIEPDAALAGAFAAKLETYRNLYPAIRSATT